MLSPTPGAQWGEQSWHYVTWNGNPTHAVDIAYWENAAKGWSTIASGVTGTRWRWQVPAGVTSQARIRITRTSDPNVRDETRGRFNVISADDAGYVMPEKYRTMPNYTKRHLYQDVWSSPDGVTWDRAVDYAPWDARHYHDVAVFDGRMWVLEGYDGAANRNDVWYSRDSSNWYELPATLWSVRHAASVFNHANGLWMVAGNHLKRSEWIGQPQEVWKLTRLP